MRRALAIGGAALVGCNAGYVVHQFLAGRPARLDDPEAHTLTVAAPVSSLLAAAAAGVARGPVAAFATGFVVAAAAGSRLDEKIPGLGRVYSSVR